MAVIPKFAFTVQNLYDSGQLKQSDVDILRAYLKSLNMPYQCDEQLAVFIRACRGDIELAKKYASVHYRGRKVLPELFASRKLDESFRREWNTFEIGVLPERTEEGDAVLIFRIQDVSFSKFRFDHACKVLLMVVDSVLYDEAVTGFVCLVDLKNLKFGHFLKIQMSILARMMKSVSEGLLAQLKAVHLINGGFLIDKLLKIFQMICSKELYNLFLNHPSKINWEDFYAKHIPKRCLPSDYGGVGDPMEELHEQMWNKLESIQEFFDQEVEYRAQYEKVKQ